MGQKKKAPKKKTWREAYIWRELPPPDRDPAPGGSPASPNTLTVNNPTPPQKKYHKVRAPSSAPQSSFDHT